MNEQGNFLPKNHIQVVETMDNWQLAVDLASQPLIDHQLITQEYVDNMKQSVTQHGPYMVLADYFALMHAQPGEGVHKQSMSLLVSKQAIDLVGKPVKVFLILAAEDHTKHLASLQAVVSVLTDEEKYQTILTGNHQKIVQFFN